MKLIKQTLLKSSVKGFTLVELLVVVAIIAILSAVGVTVYSNIQLQTKNEKRKADIQAIHKALEIYKSNYGLYPGTNGQSCGGTGGCPTTAPSDTSAWTALVGGSSYYSSGASPVDPINASSNGKSYTYVYDGLGGLCINWLENNSTQYPYCIGPQQ